MDPAPRRRTRAIVLVAVAVALGALGGLAALVATHRSHESGDSLVGMTRSKVRRLAFEAYPAWAVAHPDQECPPDTAALAAYLPSSDANDAWGHPIVLICGRELPRGAVGVAIESLGEDGKDGTCDDVLSWDEHHRCE